MNYLSTQIKSAVIENFSTEIKPTHFFLLLHLVFWRISILSYSCFIPSMREGLGPLIPSKILSKSSHLSWECFELYSFHAPPTYTPDRSRRPELLLGKGVLKIYSKFTREYPCRSAISMKLQSSFIEIALWQGCSSVNLLHIFRTSFY